MNYSATCLRLALILGAVSVSTQAIAYSVTSQDGNLLRWPTSRVGFELNANGSDDIRDGSDLVAVRKTVAEWNDVSCSDIELAETRTTTETDTVATTNRTDGINRLAWVEDRRWSFGSYVLAVTTPVFNNEGVIQEADIAFNGYSVRWSTDGGRGVDVDSVVLHELGHFFGLQHVLEGAEMDDPPTMAPSIDPQLRTRGLTADDIAGACFLYPSQGQHACAGNHECPRLIGGDGGDEYYVGTMTCGESQVCNEAPYTPGTLALGQRCSRRDECEAELYCQPTSVGNYCTRDCEPGGETSGCPSNFACVPFQDADKGACMPASLVGNTTCSCDTTWACDRTCACDTDCAPADAASPASHAAVRAQEVTSAAPPPAHATGVETESSGGCASVPGRTTGSLGLLTLLFGGFFLSRLASRLVKRPLRR